MIIKRNLTQWFYFLVGIRDWELLGTDYFPIIDSNTQLYLGQVGITKFRCRLSLTKKSIYHDLKMYDEPC